MNNFRKFRKNSKAISPIFATLILIAIAVIAGVVVYMFTSGTLATMTSGGTAGQEKIAVQTASISKAGNTVAYVEQTGGPAATINSLIIKDSSGNTVSVLSGASLTISPAGALTKGTLTSVTAVSPSAITVGTSYTVTVTTAAGGSFVSSGIVAVA